MRGKHKPDPLRLLAELRDAGLPIPQTEVRFHARRMWRFDFAYETEKIAIEIEGGIFIRGRHTRGAGYAGDMEKYNAANYHGWTVFRFTHAQVANGYAVRLIQRYLTKRQNDGQQ